jgi:chloramphenicol O-acetyltransferase type B
MIKSHLRLFLKYLDYKRRYPNTYIAFGADVRKDSFLGKNVAIEANSLVIGSEIGDNSFIDKDCYISQIKTDSSVLVQPKCHLTKIEIGKFSYIGLNSLMYNTKIGNFCSIGPNMICSPGDHPINFVSTSAVFFLPANNHRFSFSNGDKYFEYAQETTVGHDVWIGARVFIRNGVKIGNGAIIAAGAVVVKDVPDYAIVGGVPAKTIRFRFSDAIISELLKIQWWNWSEDKLRKAQSFFIKENIESFIQWVHQDDSCGTIPN